MRHQDRHSQALRPEGGGLKGYSGIVLVVTVTWGLSVAASQGRSVTEEQLSELAAELQSRCSPAY